MAAKKRKKPEGTVFRLRCTTAFKERLRLVAKRQRRSMSNLSVLALEEYCEKEEARLAKLADAKAAQAVSDLGNLNTNRGA